MAQITVQLPDDTLQRLREEAEREQLPLDTIVLAAVEIYLDGDETDTPDEEILADIRQSMHEVRAGQTLPVEDVIQLVEAKTPHDVVHSTNL